MDQARPGKRVEPSAYDRAVGILVSAGQQITTIDDLTLHEAIHYAAAVEDAWTTRQVLELRLLQRARQ